MAGSDPAEVRPGSTVDGAGVGADEDRVAVRAAKDPAARRGTGAGREGVVAGAAVDRAGDDAVDDDVVAPAQAVDTVALGEGAAADVVGAGSTVDGGTGHGQAVDRTGSQGL